MSDVTLKSLPSLLLTVVSDVNITSTDNLQLLCSGTASIPHQHSFNINKANDFVFYVIVEEVKRLFLCSAFP